VLNIYQHIDKNKRVTFLVMLSFVALIGILGWFIGENYLYISGYASALIAIIISTIVSISSYYTADKTILSLSKAVEVKSTDNVYLHSLVENMSIASGIPKPKIYIIEDMAMNAFATGRDPNHSVICFTRGIIEGLEKRELEGVIAHEMSHIGNRDTLLMTIVSVLVGSIALISDWFTRGAFYGGSRKRSSSSGLFFLIGLFLLLLSPIIASFIRLAISRNREYLADATAALITRYPKGLADALAKLAADTSVLNTANSSTSHLFIDDPVIGRKNSWLANLYNTHPPIEERIKRLYNM